MINFSNRQPKYFPLLSCLIGLLLLVAMVWSSWLENNQDLYAQWAIKTRGYFHTLADSPIQSVRLITALFIHGNWSHWLVNCSVFVLLSFSIERVLGWKKLALVYFGSGVLGQIIAIMTMQESNTFLLGASGAVSGLIGSWLVLFPNRNIRFIIPIGLYIQKTSLPLTAVVAVWLGIQVLLQFMPVPTFNVAWLSHIVGFVAGFLLTRFVK